MATPPPRPVIAKRLPNALIGFSGKDLIKEAWESDIMGATSDQALEKAKQFMREFRLDHRFQHSRLDEAINLFEAAGNVRNKLAKDVMIRLVASICEKIATLNQTQLGVLLHQSYSYLTVPELAPIAITTLDYLKNVKTEVWSQIVENGLNSTPYVDLPLSIRHRIWMQEERAFNHEVDLIIDTLVDIPDPTLQDLDATMDSRKKKNPVLAELARLVQDLGDDLLGHAIERLRVRAAQETNSAKRIAIANLFHEFMLLASSRINNNWLGTVRRCARFLSRNTGAEVVTPETVTIICEGLIHVSSADYVTLLVCSTYSRDFLADQLCLRLYGHRIITDSTDPSFSEHIIAHLKNDATLVNLTRLVMINFKGFHVNLEDRVLDEDVMVPFESFYPIMISEMFADARAKRDAHRSENGQLVGNMGELNQMLVADHLTRCVLSTYCLQLHIQDDIVGLSRFRLLLDAIASTGVPREEARELCLAYSLVCKIYEHDGH